MAGRPDGVIVWCPEQNRPDSFLAGEGEDGSGVWAWQSLEQKLCLLSRLMLLCLNTLPSRLCVISPSAFILGVYFGEGHTVDPKHSCAL